MSSQIGASADNNAPIWVHPGCLHLRVMLVNRTIVFVPVYMHWSVMIYLSIYPSFATYPGSGRGPSA